MTTTSGGTGGRGGLGTKMAIAAVFAIGATAIAAWQWSAYSRPRPDAKAEREARLAESKQKNAASGTPAQAAAPGDTPTDGAPGGEPGEVRKIVGGSGASMARAQGPGGAGGPGEVHAGNVEDAAKQMGMSVDEFRDNMSWMKPDADVLPDATFEYQKAKSDEEARTVRELLERNIEKAAPSLLTWSTAPSKEAGDLAKASTEALLGRVRGDSAYRDMISKLGGKADALPPADALPKGGAAMREALDGASIDPNHPRLRKGPSGDGPMGMMPKGGPAGATMVMKNRMGDGPELTQMITPAGSLFPDTSADGDKKLHSVEVRVPLSFATVSTKPGMSSLAVTMVHVKDGVWQPSQFALYIADDAASKALMPRRGP